MKFNNKYHLFGNVQIGTNVRIGDGTIIYDNVEIADNSIVANDCVIGEPLSDYYYNNDYINPKTVIGQNSLIRSHTIIYAGNTIGGNFQSGHRATIRENSIIGCNCSIGTLSDIQGFVRIGNYCRLHSNVFIPQYTVLNNFVFVYPGVIMTNDKTPPSNKQKGPFIDDYSQISAGSVILADVRIGKNCLIGAGSVVTTHVNDYSLVSGNPARFIKDVREIKSWERDNFHYPWMCNFVRGMPWEDIGYDAWVSLNWNAQ